MLIHRPIGQGYVYSSEDYTAGELVTHAQSARWLVGFSDLGDVLLQGTDPHSDLAANVLGVSYADFLARKKEPRFKNARQASKPQNFGRPGGSGSPTIVLQQRKQGPDTPHPNGPSTIKDEATGLMVPGWKGLRFCVLMDGSSHCGFNADGTPNKVRRWGRSDKPFAPACAHCIECCDRLGATWKKRWRENVQYFKFVKDCVDHGMIVTHEALDRWPHARDWFTPGQRLDPGEIMQHVTCRVRGGISFTSGSNGFFQGLLADIAKEAHRIAVRECYDRSIRVPDMLFPNSIRSEFAGLESPLFGSRIPAFFHDELLGEHPRSIAHEAATRISEIMRDVLRWRCSDYADAAKAEPTLMARWTKAAECVRDANGRLVVWEPQEATP